MSRKRDTTLTDKRHPHSDVGPQSQESLALRSSGYRSEDENVLGISVSPTLIQAVFLKIKSNNLDIDFARRNQQLSPGRDDRCAGWRRSSNGAQCGSVRGYRDVAGRRNLGHWTLLSLHRQ